MASEALAESGSGTTPVTDALAESGNGTTPVSTFRRAFRQASDHGADDGRRHSAASARRAVVRPSSDGPPEPGRHAGRSATYEADAR